MMASHPLSPLLHDAAAGRFPRDAGDVEVMPALPDGLEAVVAFTAHAVIATAREPRHVFAREPDGFGAALAPDFLRWLAGPGGDIGVIDCTLVAFGTGGPPRLEAREDFDHPRVRHAHSLRQGVRVFGDQRGLVTLASGLAGRRELSIELESAYGNGSGRGLITDALSLVSAGEPVFAAVSPGNARSLRAFLAAGFTPLGAEVIIRPSRDIAR